MRLIVVVHRASLTLVRVPLGGAESCVTIRRSVDAAFDQQVTALLGQQTTRTGWRSRVDVLLDGEYSQVRRIEGLPELPRLDELTAIVREDPFAFFLRTTSAVVVSQTHRAQDGALWAAAFDASALLAIGAGIRRAGFRVGRVASLVVADSVKREIWVTPGNALAIVAGPLALRSLTPSVLSSARRWRAAIVTIALASSAYLAPGAHAMLLLRQAGPQDGLWSDAAPAFRDLQGSSMLLHAIDGSDANRGRMIRFITALIRVLPDSTVIPSLRVDSVDATFVVVSRRVGDLLESIEREHLLTGTRFVGGLRRAGDIDSARTRVTIRGHLAASFR